MQDLSVLRCSRAPFTAARSSFAGGRRLELVDRRLQAHSRRPSLKCNAVAEVESDVEKRGEARGKAFASPAITTLLCHRHLLLPPPNSPCSKRCML